MTTSVIVVGAGPAAAGVALALDDASNVEVTVLDLGERLEADRQRLVQRMASQRAEDWSAADVLSVAEQPVAAGSGGLPQKRAYGSDFPFRDVGQLDSVTAERGGNRSVVSAAHGGFSNVWGAQVMTFSASALREWPGGLDRLRPHYRAVTSRIPYAAEEDDLAEAFPLIGPSVPLPPLSPRGARVLDAYQANRSGLNRAGITMGKARLALDASSCVLCGLCMTGCPYSLIYAASHTLEGLRTSGRIRYLPGLNVLRVEESADRATVVALDLATDELCTFTADRVYVACGGIGTTRLVANSLGWFDRDLAMLESQQFVLPFFSRRATSDPRDERQFTLNQFNMTVGFDDRGYDLSQLHFYTYNPAFSDALPAILRFEPVHRQLLRRLSVALGYLPSWRSPGLTLRIGAPAGPGGLPPIQVGRGARPTGPSMLRSVLGRLLSAAPRLDLYPVLPMLRLAGPGKSYHFGGSFPHATSGRAGPGSSDEYGRVAGWRRIHLVDGAVFPNVPATTFTLTVMANAHRIATESIGLES